MIHPPNGLGAVSKPPNENNNKNYQNRWAINKIGRYLLNCDSNYINLISYRSILFVPIKMRGNDPKQQSFHGNSPHAVAKQSRSRASFGRDAPRLPLQDWRKMKQIWLRYPAFQGQRLQGAPAFRVDNPAANSLVRKEGKTNSPLVCVGLQIGEDSVNAKKEVSCEPLMQNHEHRHTTPSEHPVSNHWQALFEFQVLNRITSGSSNKWQEFTHA